MLQDITDTYVSMINKLKMKNESTCQYFTDENLTGMLQTSGSIVKIGKYSHLFSI